MDYPPVYVADTSIWIDLYRGDILEKAFQLPLRLVAPDVIVQELEEPDGHELVRLGLESRELSGEQVAEVASLVSKYRGTCTNDLFALVLAKALNATLLTGDGKLRQAADHEKVLVHGTLWMLDEMIRNRVIAPARAADALQKMLDAGSRLPKDEVNHRLRIWRR